MIRVHTACCVDYFDTLYCGCSIFLVYLIIIFRDVSNVIYQVHFTDIKFSINFTNFLFTGKLSFTQENVVWPL